MKHIFSFAHLVDTAVVTELHRHLTSERSDSAAVVALLAELEFRRLHLQLGYPSTFDYCFRVLKLSEHEAYNRIEVARASRKFPVLLEKLADGCLSLSAIRLLAPHLTPDNFDRLTREAEGKRIEGIKLLIAALKPQPAVPFVVRKLPEPKPASRATPAGSPSTDEPTMSLSELVTPPVAAAAPPSSRRPTVAPLSESHYKLQVTISASARERLSQIQDLMRHRIPNGDPAAIVEHALEVLHAQLLREKAAIVRKPRAGKSAREPRGRCIPARVKRDVFRRDEGKCAFVAADGRKCGSTSGVEFHHVQPYAAGGEASVKNIAMRCRAHNGFEWERHLDAETAALATR